MTLHKLTDPIAEAPVVWPQRYRREGRGVPDRLAIAPRSSPLALLATLAEHIGPDHYLLFVHCVARSGHERGRYQSPLRQLVDVRIFLQDFAELLEHDARHSLWIGTPGNQGLLVYEEHGLVYAYGPLAEFERSLEGLGFEQGTFSIPSPHAHHFHGGLDDEVERLLGTWERFDLQPEDER
jgi:hypothetical protein